MTIINSQNPENPLLAADPIKLVDQFNAEFVEPAVQQVIAENWQAIEELLKQANFSWQNFMLPMDELENRLGKIWSIISHLNSVCNNEALRKAHDQALAHLTEYSTQLGQHQGLYQATKQLYEKRQDRQLSDTQVHILKHALIDFNLSGLHLAQDKQQQFSKIQARLAELTSKFEQNLLDATMSWSKSVEDKAQLVGLPETELALLAANAKARDLPGFLITLEIPSYLALMTYADNRQLREEVYAAYTTRASETGPDQGKFDNSEIMAELLKLKNEKARLLGFDNYAQLSLETKMAESPEQVVEFLHQLNDASQSQAAAEFESLKEYARQQGCDSLQAWDIAYFSEKLRHQQFEISQTELRPYFPANKVVNGMFELASHHFDISFQKVAAPVVWQSSVEHFQIQKQGQVIAEFYLDLYARSHKRGGAWMNDYCGRLKHDNGEVQAPVAYLTCNFTPPVNDQQALLTHDEVVTLFHEFGHGLHHMLTQIDELSASGISNVPWDAVELPSQFMENFCYQPEVIKKISGHFETEQPLPEAMLEKLIRAKNFQSAMAMIRQLEFALFDMNMYLSEPLSSEGIQQLLDSIRSEVSVFAPPEFNRFQHGFSHIFSGGYAAGYYSYKWAEILSADAFSLFEEEGIMNPAAGERFLTHILAKGGSVEPMALFEKFRGRKPEIEPLLRHSGIKQ